MKLFTKILFIPFLLFCFSFHASAQTANFSADRISGCNPLVVLFSDRSTGTITSYSWDFGNSITSTLKDPSTTFVDAGTYTVKLTVRNGSGTPSTKTMTITVFPSPKVAYTAGPVSICPCENVTFTNSSVANAPGTYTSIWSFGDGITSTDNNTTHNYCRTGSYNVALKITNSAGCVSTRVDTAKVIVNEKPLAAFSASRLRLCKIPDTTVFSSTASRGKPPYRYSWDFGDFSTPSTLANPSHAYTSTGVFTVRLIVTDDNGCKDTITRVNYITSQPIHADFKIPASSCPGDGLVRFDGTSTPTPSGTTWLWSDGGSASGSSAQRTFWKGGTYTITMVADFGPGCMDTAIKNYMVYPKPRPNFSYSPIYPCPAPATITFVNKSNDADSFTWLFGDGTTSALKNPLHTYTKDSIFTVFLIAKTSFGCLDTFRVRDTTKPFPGGYPSSSRTGLFDSFNSPVIIRVHPGKLNITVDSLGGCLPFVVKPIATLCGRSFLPADTSASGCPVPVPKGYVSPPYWKCGYAHATDHYPDEYADPYILPSKTSCTGPSAHPYPIVKYKWDFGGGVTSTLDSPTYTYTTEGEHWIKVTVETHNGCTYTDSILVTSGNRPKADFFISAKEVCNNDSITVINTSKNGGNAFTFIFSDGTIIVTTDSNGNFIHKFRKSGIINIKLKASRYGCIDTTMLNVNVHPPEVLNEIKYSCDTPMKVLLTDKSKGASSVLWKFGDGATSTARTVTHTYAAEGDYMMTQIAYNDTFGCVDSVRIPIKIFIAKPSFSTPNTNVCLGDTIRFNAPSRDYFDYAIWMTGDSILSTSATGFTMKYKDTGSYDVRFIGHDLHGCFDTLTRKGYILVARPRMKVSASPLIACLPALIDFTDSSTNVKGASNVSRKWYWGDASSSMDTTATKAKHTYTTTGTFTVKLVTTDNIGCKDSTTINIESRRPKADFNTLFDTFTCVGRPNKFYNASKGVALTYRWDFGDGGSSTDENPAHSYATIGTFTVKLIVTDQTGCKDSLTKIAYIKTKRPKASFTMSDSVALCPPLFVKFTNTSSADAILYDWYFGNGSTSVNPNPVSPYVDSGVYNIMLVATDKYGCTDTAFSRTRVMGYDGALKYTPLSGCAPLAVNFTADLVNADIMVWDFADGVTESAAGKLTTTHTYTKPGAYVPRLILGDGKGCSTSSKGLDTIKVDGVAGVIDHTPGCIGTEVTFNDASSSYFSTYSSSEWLFQDGSTATGKNPTRTYDKTGTYSVQLISTNTNGCKDTVRGSITINDLPHIKAEDTIICLGDNATLYANGGVSYSWQPDPTLSCSACNNPVTSTKVTRDYIVTGTDANGCTNTDTLTVGVKTKTKIKLQGDTEVCAKTPIQLNASGAQGYLWIPATFLNNASISNPVATMDSTVIYRVIGTEGSCIPDTGLLKVTVHPLPLVNAGPDQKVLAGTEVQLNGSGKNIKSYLWFPAETLNCTVCENPLAKPLQTTTYTLRGTSEFGCSDSDDVIITVFCDQSQLFIPNTFTPNGDGQNDYFYPQGQGVAKIRNFIIYNRWGQKVFERNNIDPNIREQGWDGSFNGQALTPDTFVYTLEVTCDNGETVSWKGDITLLK